MPILLAEPRQAESGCWVPVRRLGRESVKALGRAAGIQVVRRVTLAGEVWDFDDAGACGNATKRASNHLGVIAACIVVVGHDHRIGVLQEGCMFRSPLPGATRIAGRDDSEARQPINVLLALDDVDGPILRDGLKQLGQTVRQDGAPLHAPLCFRSALTKVLRLQPHDLELPFPVRVLVRVDSDDRAPRDPFGPRLSYAELGRQPCHRILPVATALLND